MTPNRKAAKAKPAAPKMPKAPKAPRVPKKPPTREELLAAVGRHLDEVDAFMAARDIRPGARLTEWMRFYYGPLAAVAAKLRTLLDKLEGTKGAGGPGALAMHFTTPPGEKLKWSRPGSVVMWIEGIPVRCVWGGFLQGSDNSCTALLPRKLFLDSSGAAELYVGQIDPLDEEPEQALRKRIMQRLHVRSGYGRQNTPEPPLVQLSQDGIEKVNAFRADPAHAWWLTAAAGTPVDPIPMPANLPAIQTTLLG